MIGYEFECLSLFEDDDIKNSIKKIFGKSVAKKFIITTDSTIKRDRSTKSEDGWSAWEIITPPLPNDEAIDVLSKMQDYLIESGVATNKSCGFHVNISSKKMRTFDPMTLIACVDEYKFAKTYSREENPYCVPWSHYFGQIAKRVYRDKTVVDKLDTIKINGQQLVYATSIGQYVEDTAYKYAKNAAKYFDEKYLTTNISKLTLSDPYIEFRMMGGKDYHLKALKPMVKELVEHIEYAAKGCDTNVINKYFHQYNI